MFVTSFYSTLLRVYTVQIAFLPGEIYQKIFSNNYLHFCCSEQQNSWNKEQANKTVKRKIKDFYDPWISEVFQHIIKNPEDHTHKCVHAH